MALKSKITKAEFDALADALKAVYKELNGSYVLDSDDANELRVAKERSDAERTAEKARADALQATADAAAEALRQAELDAAKKKGDVAAIETSWQAKVDAAIAEGIKKLDAMKEKLRRLLVTNVALAMASEISNSPDLILPHIEKRLQADVDGDEPTTRVLGLDGKPTALKIDELKQEFVANEKFAAIVIGSKATGGGAGKGGNGGGAPTGKKISELNEAERVALHASIGASEFQRRMAAERAA